jgi:hypothetical protein
MFSQRQYADSVIWDLIPCSLREIYSVLEDVNASMFWVEDKTKKVSKTQETQAAELLRMTWRHILEYSVI